jgi:hypothetical protein
MVTETGAFGFGMTGQQDQPSSRIPMRQNFKDVIVPVVAAIMAASCSGRQTDSTSPGIADDRTGRQTISGAWAHTAIGPVYREFMTLSQSGTHVTGTGEYAIEAGRAGPTLIEGDWSGSRLTLIITRDYGLRETFTGTLTDQKHLVGALVIDGFAQDFNFAKQ